MNFNLPQQVDLIFNAAFAKTAFYISLTILIAVIIDHILRSLVKVPKHFGNRRTLSVAMLIRSLITIVVYSLAAYTILVLLGINLAPLLASASIIGIVLGIGGRQIIEDLIAGIFLLSQDSIAFGDYVKIDDTTEGTIEKIGYRTLNIRSFDGSLHMIPNGQIKKVINFSRHGNKANALIKIPVKSDQDITRILKAATTSLEQLKKDEDFSEAISSDSKVNGIEEIQPLGPMIVLVTIIVKPDMRFDAARKYRYLLKKLFEKDKLNFG
jgi:small-conductance mechanosensitive channel